MVRFIQCPHQQAPSSHGRRIRAASGSNTISDSQRSVMPKVKENPGTQSAAQAASFPWRKYPVEHTIICEIGRLRRIPAAKIGDGCHLECRITFGIFCHDR